MASATEDLATLAALSRLHQQCVKLERAEHDIQKNIEGAARERKECASALEAVHSELRALTLRSRDIDRESSGLKDDSTRLKHVVEASGTTAMMNAAERELATKERQRDDLENEGLGVLEQIEGLDNRIKTLQQHMETIARASDEQVAKLKQAQASSAMELPRIKGEMEAVKAKLSEDARVIYNAATETHGDGALCWIDDGGVCSGCNSQVPPGVKVTVDKKAKAVRCPACGRVLLGVR